MYKKITHNIVEEHFEHPMTLPVSARPQAPLVSAAWQLPPYKNVYISSLQNQFIQYNIDLRSAIKSAVANSSDNEFNIAQITITSNGLIPFFELYFGRDNSQTIAGYFSSYALSLLDIVNAVKAGTDFSELQAISLNHLFNLIKLIDGIYPDWWTPVVFTPQGHMTDYNQAMVQQIVSRHAADWLADYKAAELSNIVLWAGGSNPPYFINQDFVRILANSIVRKFSSEFT